MLTFASRAGRRPLALTFVALTALAACNDEPVAPKTRTPTPLAAKVARVAADTYYVTTTSGGMEPGSIRSIAKKMEYSGGTILFDPALAGKTITLEAGFEIYTPAAIIGPAKGITISGNNTFRLMYVSSLTLENVTLTKGHSDFASALESASLIMRHSTVHGNTGSGSAVWAASKMELVNSTISGNPVGGPVVEFGHSAEVLIDNSTIAFNGPSVALGPYRLPTEYMRVTLRNSILSNNGQNCLTYTGFWYEGTNIVDDWSCADVAITPSDPKLLPLAYNGGPNMTHAIPFNSPAFNKGVDCWNTVDQRYVPRDAKCDVGAFEFTDFTKVTITIDPNVRVDATAPTRALVTGTVTCSRNETFKLALELHQDQKVGKNVVDVHAAAAPTVTCGTTATGWAQKLILTEGAWQAGAAQATAQTYQAAEWVTPASAASPVKIAINRR